VNKMTKRTEGYEKVADKQDLQQSGVLKVESDGNPIVLSMVNSEVYAIDAVCSHEESTLNPATASSGR